MKLKCASWLLGIAMCFLTACTTTVLTSQCKTPYNKADLEPYGRPGAGIIKGQAFLMTRGGDVKLGAGQTVTLTPATAFVKECRQLRDSGIVPISVTEEISKELKSYSKTTTVDAQGNYEFTDLAPGEYLLEVKIEWSTGKAMTGGFVKAYAVAENGKVTKKMLTE